jgi:hypothetical protein
MSIVGLPFGLLGTYWYQIAGASAGIWHACRVSSSTPENEHEPEHSVPDRVRNDGRAAMAITVLAALLIIFLISRLV